MSDHAHHMSEHGHRDGQHAHPRLEHGPVPHAASAEVVARYEHDLAAAVPDPGRSIVAIGLDPRPTAWAFEPGAAFDAWAFNGQVPGPVIEGRVGDVLEVRLTNGLPEATSIHWHGLRVPASMDGTDSVQRPVEPGTTFTYRFRLPDAGTFWYHPHSNETVQMERGLYGPILVRGDDEPVFDADRVLVFDDLKLDTEGRVARFGGLVQRHDGREGDIRLVNGTREPELHAAAGQVERWRIVNASSARYVRLSVGGRPFRVIGTDGGLIERPVEATEVLLPPADRVELAVGPFEEGESLPIESLTYSRQTIRKRKAERFGTLHVGPARPSMASIPDRLRTIAPLAPPDAAPNRKVNFGVRPSLRRGFEFVINKQVHCQDDPVSIGELQVWDVYNSTLMDHPFHLHGFFFQVLSVDGKPPAWRSWEDVVNLPPRTTTRIAWMPDDRPGSWMYHCHILEHHAAGMMAHFDVVPRR